MAMLAASISMTYDLKKRKMTVITDKDGITNYGCTYVSGFEPKIFYTITRGFIISSPCSIITKKRGDNKVESFEKVN